MKMELLDRPVRADSLSSQVVEILKDAIFSGKLRPGEPLREMQLASALQVSQATVREALGNMEKTGLVVRVPKKGTTVTNPSTQEVRDRLKIRSALEELALIDAAPCMAEKDFQQLERLIGKIREASERSAYFEISQADLEFHRFIWKKSGNPILYRTLDQLTTPLFAFLGLNCKLNRIDLATTRSHEQLVEALRSQSPTTIHTAVRDHIMGSYDRFLNPAAE